jgi:hypothetical protein
MTFWRISGLKQWPILAGFVSAGPAFCIPHTANIARIAAITILILCHSLLRWWLDYGSGLTAYPVFVPSSLFGFSLHRRLIRSAFVCLETVFFSRLWDQWGQPSTALYLQSVLLMGFSASRYATEFVFKRICMRYRFSFLLSYCSYALLIVLGLINWFNFARNTIELP